MSAPPSSPRARVHASLVAGWLALVAIGMSLLFHESFEPGEVATAPPTWPSDSALELAADRHTLVVVVHPQCSCTRATLTELEWVTDRLGDRLATFVLFGTSDDVDWRASPLLDRALAIRGVTVVADEDAREAQRFGAQTSGQVYLFAPDGTLAFEGGITPSRAHAGDNVGRQRIVALVEGGRADRATSAVYGCGLGDEAARRFWLPALRPAELVGGTRTGGEGDDVDRSRRAGG